MNLDIELQPGSSIRVETPPHELLQAQVIQTLEGVRIEIQNGTQFYLTFDPSQAEHLIYELQQCLNLIEERCNYPPLQTFEFETVTIEQTTSDAAAEIGALVGDGRAIG